MPADTISTRGELGSSDSATVPNLKGSLVFLQLSSIEDVVNLVFGCFFFHLQWGGRFSLHLVTYGGMPKTLWSIMLFINCNIWASIYGVRLVIVEPEIVLGITSLGLCGMFFTGVPLSTVASSFSVEQKVETVSLSWILRVCCRKLGFVLSPPVSLPLYFPHPLFPYSVEILALG